MNEQGFIVLHRKLLGWKYAQFPHAVALWVYLIIKANWKPAWFLGIEIPRGSLATSMQSLAAQTGMEVHTVRKWLKRFEENGQITRKSTNRFTIINITNYAVFQDLPDDGYSEQDSKQNGKQDSKQNGKQSSNNRTNKQSNKVTNKQRVVGTFVPPTLEEIQTYVSENMFIVDPERFFDYYQANGWTIGGKGKMKDWKAAVRNWDRKDQEKKREEEREEWAF